VSIDKNFIFEQRKSFTFHLTATPCKRNRRGRIPPTKTTNHKTKMADPILYEATTCGHDVKFPGPATVEDFDAKAGEPGACLAGAIKDEIYRGTLPAFHRALTPKLEALTGVKREVDAEKTAAAKAKAKNPDNVADILVSFKSYLKDAEAKFVGEQPDDESKAVARKQIDDLMKEVALTIEIDPSPTVKGEAFVKKGDLAKADSILSRSDEEIDAKVSQFLAAVPDYDLARDDDGKPERKSFAKLIGLYLETVLA
jgi:hypothetical protein